MGIIKVPGKYYNRFKSDPYESSRNILSIPLGALHPLFSDISKVDSCLLKDINNPFDSDSMSFDEDFYPDDFSPRYMHIDIGISHDSLGVSMVHVKDWKKVEVHKKKDGLTVSNLPVFKIDFLGKVEPAKNEDIRVSDIRELIIYELDDRGFPLDLITYDKFGSLESRQMLRDEGFNIGKLSLDRTTSYPVVDYSKRNNIKTVSTKQNYSAAWDCLYDAIQQKRAIIPFNSSFRYESRHAEKKVKGNKVKIDAPSNDITLDLLESVAGSMFNTMNNERYTEIDDSDIENEEDRKERRFYDQFEDSRNFDRLKNERNFNTRRIKNSKNKRYDKYE